MAERVLGADVSHWQAEIDWGKMAKTGVRYVFIKATDGVAGLDERLNLNWQGALKAKLYRGAYHFFRSEYNPKQQAKFFFDTLTDLGGTGELPPVLDVEHRPLRASNVKECLDELERLFGKPPIVYTAPGLWNEMGNVSWAKEYKLWVAQYPYRSWSDSVLDGVTRLSPRLPFGWNDWLFWQFTEKGPGPAYGVGSRSIDLNHYQGSETSFLAYIGKDTLGGEIVSGGQEVRVVKDIAEQYIDALNSRKPDEIVTLYTPSAVHVNNSRTIQGPDAIRAWYAKFFIQELPNAVFTLTGYTGFGSSRHVTWKATSTRGTVIDGNDTLGLIDDKIAYHFTSYKIS